MANELDKPRGRGKKIAGIILFWVGITGIFLGLLSSFTTLSSLTNLDTPEAMPVIEAEILIAIVSCPIAIIGIILYFVGRRQAKKQKNQNIPLA